MRLVEIGQKIVRGIVIISVGHVSARLIDSNLKPKNNLEKAEVMIGAYVVGAMASDAAGDWTDRKMEDLAIWWETYRKNRF